MSDTGKIRSTEEIREVVRLARSRFAEDPDKQTSALRNPISYLTDTPYKLSVQELAAAYDDAELNVAHPNHPAHSQQVNGIGCILCGVVQDP